jgi:pseudouridine kinase
MRDYACVIGGINIDIKGIADTFQKEPDSYPGKVIFTPGGVARNISENLARLDVPVYLFGCIGDDNLGNYIISETKNAGVNIENVFKSSAVNTAKYVSVSSREGNLHYAVNDMKETSEMVTSKYILDNSKLFEKCKIIAADTNLSANTLNTIIGIANQNSIPVFIDTVSSSKARIIKELNGKINYLSPNLNENENIFGNHDKIAGLLTTGIFKNFEYIIVKRGIEGVTIIDVENERFSAIESINVDVVESNGAGDAFDAGFIYAFLRECDIEVSAKIGICASCLTLKSEKSVSEELNQKILLDFYNEKISDNEF